ncbi:MAG: DUF424 domain-containing protein [Thermoplasmata archaeon]|nr:MAG: DUF424 domain-containing protein [Thermoplasmata archaeon]
MFYAKVYHIEGETLVAICDKNLLGKRFEEEKLLLEVKREFYGGNIVDREEASKLLKMATIANLVGENIISLAIELGIVKRENVLKIQNIPHAQMAIL